MKQIVSKLNKTIANLREEFHDLQDKYESKQPNSTLQELEKENKKLKNLDKDDSTTKQVLVELLKEKQEVQKGAAVLREELDDAHVNNDELLGFSVDMFKGFQRLMDLIHNSKKINLQEIEQQHSTLLNKLAEQVQEGHDSRYCDSYSQLLNEEKHRIRMKEKFAGSKCDDFKRRFT